jgi:EAL domain-containing protein (putative c-di-GMP-specific phosphodiesterase class I)
VETSDVANRSFVSDLDTDPNDAAIIDAVVGLDHELGIKIVAEGIENNVHVRYLLDRGRDYGQGICSSGRAQLQRRHPS